MCDRQSLRSACAYAQSDQSLGLSLEYSMSVKILTEHHLLLLSFKGGCTGLSENTLVKMPYCCKSHVTAKMCFPVVCCLCFVSLSCCALDCLRSVIVEFAGHIHLLFSPNLL